MLPKIKRTTIKIYNKKICKQKLTIELWHDINNGQEDLKPFAELLTYPKFKEEYIDSSHTYYEFYINYYMKGLDRSIKEFLDPNKVKYIRTQNELIFDFYLDDIGYDDRLTLAQFEELQSKIAKRIETFFLTKRHFYCNAFGFWDDEFEEGETYIGEYIFKEGEKFKFSLPKIGE